MPEESGHKGCVDMTADIATEVASFAIAEAASKEVYQTWYRMAMENALEVVDVRRTVGLEILTTDPADREMKEFYKQQSTDYRPVGKIRAKTLDKSWWPSWRSYNCGERGTKGANRE